MEEIQGVRGVVSKIQPQLIYYLAGMVTARQNLNLVLPMLRNNLVGSVQVLLVATEIGCERMVVVSSSEDLTDGIPTSPYIASKATVSTYARMFYEVYGLPVVVVKSFITYGPRQRSTKLIPYTILRGTNQWTIGWWVT